MLLSRDATDKSRDLRCFCKVRNLADHRKGPHSLTPSLLFLQSFLRLLFSSFTQLFMQAKRWFKTDSSRDLAAGAGQESYLELNFSIEITVRKQVVEYDWAEWNSYSHSDFPFPFHPTPMFDQWYNYFPVVLSVKRRESLGTVKLRSNVLLDRFCSCSFVDALKHNGGL